MVRAPRHSVPLLFSAVVIAVFFLIFWIFPTSAPGSKVLLVSELLRQYTMSGSYDQRAAFTFSLVATFALSGAAFLIGKRNLVVETTSTALPSINIWIALCLTIVGLTIYSFLIPTRVLVLASALTTAFFVFVIFGRFLHRRPVELVLFLAIGAYLTLVIAPGLMVWPIPILVSDPDSIAQNELHLLALAQPGSAIAAGQKLFREIPFSYGVLMPSIISLIDLRGGPMSVADHARFVQYTQVLLTLTAAAAYFCYRPRNYLGILVALLLAAPYWATAGLGVWHPNHTGMRSITLPLGILALILTGRYRPNNAAWVLGAVGMISLLINMETTIAVAIGVVVYFILRTRQIPVAQLTRMAISGVIFFALYLIGYRLALGRMAFGIELSTIITTFSSLTSGDTGMRLFTAGSLGENYYIVPFAFAMFLHAVYIVIAAFYRLGAGPFTHRQALKPAIATALVVWFGYYFNMPNWWQIWTHLFLYGFLLIDLFDLRLFGFGTAQRTTLSEWLSLRSRALCIVPMFLLSIMTVHTNANFAYYTQDFMFPPWIRGDHDASLVSGLLVPRAAGDALKEKTKKLTELNTAYPGKVRYLTFNVEFVPMMTRLFEPAPIRSLWGSIAGDDALDPEMDKVVATHPEIILIDAPTGPLAVTGERKNFQNRVRQSVSRHYHLTETVSGWEVYRPGPSK